MCDENTRGPTMHAVMEVGGCIQLDIDTDIFY